MEQFSRLGFLLERFGVTGKELADILHVDYSLVSKWRNHTRVLTPRSDYLQKICDYFLSLDSNNQYSNLKEIILNAYPNVQLVSAKEVSIYLKKWFLSNGQTSSDLLSSILNSGVLCEGHFYIFKGNDGKREAVTKFMEIALSDPKGQELLLFSQENPLWFNEDNDFIKSWREKNFEFLNKGGNLYIIHTIDRLYKSIAFSLIHWLPLHMTGNTLPFYYPQITDSSIKVTLFVLKDHAVIFGITADGFTKTSYTYLCLEPTLVKQCQYGLQALLSESLPLFEKFLPQNADKLMSLITKADQSDESNYYVTLPPFFLTMSQKTLKNILTENEMTEKDIEAYLGYHSVMQKHFEINSSNNFYRFIIDMNRLEKIISNGIIILDNISSYSGTHIKISKESFCNAINEMLNVLDISNIDIAILDGPPSDGLDGIDMWVKKNTIVISSTASDEKSHFSLVTSELTSVNSCFYNLNQIWNTIPKIKYDKDWIRQRLLHLTSNC